jgi:hypothetical protein
MANVDPVFDSPAMHADPDGEIAKNVGAVGGHAATGRVCGQIIDGNGHTVGEFLPARRADWRHCCQGDMY